MMFDCLLGFLFPPKRGKIHGFESVMLLHAVRQGLVKVYEAEPRESGVGRVWEWPEGRHRKPRRLR